MFKRQYTLNPRCFQNNQEAFHEWHTKFIGYKQHSTGTSETGDWFILNYRIRPREKGFLTADCLLSLGDLRKKYTVSPVTTILHPDGL